LSCVSTGRCSPSSTSWRAMNQRRGPRSMSSRSAAALLGAQEPRVLVTPPRTTSEGDDAGWLSAQYGLKPDPWQALVLDSWLGRSSAGRWAAATCGLAVPRQNGKNGVLE